MSEAYISMMELLIRRFDGSVERGLIFLVLLNRGLGDSGGPGQAGEPRPVSVNALAHSLARPFETVRRRVREIEAAGLSRRVPGGIVLAIADPAAFGFHAFKDELADILVRLIQDLRAFDVDLPAGAEDTPLHADAIVAAAIDLLLCAHEFSTPEHGDWLKMLLFVATMTANTRALAYDLELARRFADNATLPPRRLRDPIQAASVSRALHLPYATVRRHYAQMVADGRLVRAPGGFVCTDAALTVPSLLESSVALGRRMTTIFARLAARGFPFDAPERAYARGRPPLLAFGGLMDAPPR